MDRHHAPAPTAGIALNLQIEQFRSDFPEFRFVTQRTWSGMSIAAIRLGSGYGLHTVITSDPGEMRDELARSRHAGLSSPADGDQIPPFGDPRQTNSGDGM